MPPRLRRGGPDIGATRGQANVVDVALLLGVDVVAIGLLTASVGGFVDTQVASADADTAADGFSLFRDGAVAAANSSYPARVTDDDLSWVNRTVRIISETRPIRTYDAGGYVTDLGGRRVAFVGGAVVRGTGDSAAFVTPVPVAFAGDAAFLTVPVLTVDTTNGGGLGSDVALRTQTTRTVTDRPADRYAIAVETATPDVWERTFERRGFNTTQTDFDGDGTEGVVATVPDERALTVAQYDASVVIDRG